MRILRLTAQNDKASGACHRYADALGGRFLRFTRSSQIKASDCRHQGQSSHQQQRCQPAGERRSLGAKKLRDNARPELAQARPSQREDAVGSGNTSP